MFDPNQPPPPAPGVPVDANARPPLAENMQLPPSDFPMGTPPDSWSAGQAKRIVLNDFQRAAAFRTTNIEPKWQEANETYVAAVGSSKTWEGTGNGTPRANLQVHQAFQQVNALRPQIVDAICGGDLDFDVEAASSGTTIGGLQNVRSLLQYQFRSLGGQVKFQTFRANIDSLVEDGLVLGNGIQEWGWDGPRTEQVVNWQKVVEPEMQQTYHPLLPGVPINRPTGRMISYAQQNYVPKVISQFFLDKVDNVDFYIDPNCRGVNVQMADFCLRRKMMTVADIASYRGQEGWDVPDDKTLLFLAQKKWNTEGDTSRQWMQSQQGVNAPTGEDYSLDPRLNRLEVLRYWQKGRHVWLLGREHVMWNKPNQYNALPFFNWCYVNKPGAFYGFSIPELLRTDQKLIKTLLDGRLDEVNLILHPPIISKRGTFRSQAQSKFRPGANWEADEPTKDIYRMEMGNVTQNAYVEVDAAENRGQKKTGVTDLAGLGTPSTGGNSANRTATGVQAQTTASSTRVHGLVAYIEDTFLEPLLEQVWELIKMYMTPEQVAAILGPQAEQFQLDPVDILNSDPKFSMKTASRMKMRGALQNGGLNTVLQYFLNPEVGTLMGEQQNKTLDIEALSETVCDVFHMKAYNFFRPLTPQEMQARQQRQASGVQEKMALQTARLQAMSQDAQERDETKIMVALIQGLAQAGLLHTVQGVEAPVKLEARRLDAEIEGGQFEQPPAAQ